MCGYIVYIVALYYSISLWLIYRRIADASKTLSRVEQFS